MQPFKAVRMDDIFLKCGKMSLILTVFLSQSRRLPPLQVVSNSKFVSVGVGSLTNVFIIKHYITEVKKLNKFCPKSYRTFLHCTDNVFLAYNGKEK